MWFGVATLTVLVAVTAGELVVEKGQRTIDLSSHLVNITTQLTIKNSGGAEKAFTFTPEKSMADHLAWISASTGSGDEEQPLEVQKAGAGFSVKFVQPLGGDSSIVVRVDTVYSHVLQPYPAQIAQSEEQLVKYSGNLFIPSTYSVKTQTTNVLLFSAKVPSYTKVKPFTFEESKKQLKYGPYTNKEAGSEQELMVHLENNSPFLVVKTLERIIEVSHWGNIAVEEHYDMHHHGALLKGPFSRYDFQMKGDGVSCVKNFKSVLPAAARDVYYRDDIGNISTSNMRETLHAVELEVRPRFPLFGGWKNAFYIGYNIPSYEFLYHSGNSYALNMPFVEMIYDDMLVDELTVKIILPEVTSNFKMHAPYDVQILPQESISTYLDTSGRPILVYRKRNVVEQHIQNFQLEYTFRPTLMFREPLMLVAAFTILFATVIFYSHLDFTITKDELAESRMRVGGLLEDAANLVDLLIAGYVSWEAAIQGFKSSKDNSAFQASLKKVEGELKTSRDALAGIQQSLKTEQADQTEKLGEVLRNDTTAQTNLRQLNLITEKLVSGKMTRQQYLAAETDPKNAAKEATNRIEAVINHLQ